MDRNMRHIELAELTDMKWLRKKYFSSPDQRVTLKKGDKVLTQGKKNDRIFFVEEGILSGYNSLEGGEEIRLFSTRPGMIAGIYSFFSQDERSYTTVKADEDSVVYFVKKSQVPEEGDPEYPVFMKHMMPVIVNEIYLRQMRLMQSTREKHNAMNKLIQSEKLATLGQLSAGLAHELNNAIGVIQNKTIWLTENFKSLFGKKKEFEAFRFFENGLEKGQTLSSMEIRKRKRKLVDKLKLKESDARKLARIDLSEEELTFLSRRRSGDFINEVNNFWDTGLALHDMNVASSHTTHVITSIKELGKPHQDRLTSVNLSDTINKSLALLGSMLKHVELVLELDDSQFVNANEGKLVQVWLNLVKNAVESLINSKVKDPKINISVKRINGMTGIDIIDNGPGIKKELLPTIFQPNVTTKIEGISFGLGLGLPIVHTIINDLNGTIDVSSEPGNTIFKIQIPN